MLKRVDKESPNATRLVLGFDGGCLSCSMLAEHIKEQVGDKLEIKSLRDPQVQGWRKETLGEDAPWAPTLVEVHGEEASRAWTGLRMGAALTRRLGPADTWRVMQAIGEMRPTKESLIPGGFSRGQFLTGVGGAALAMTMLSGTGKLARPAAAHGDHREFKGSDLVDRARNKSDAQDVVNIVQASAIDDNWNKRMQTAEVIRKCYNDGPCAIVFATGDNCVLEKVGNDKFDTDGYCTIPRAVRHLNIEGGDNNVLVVAYAIPRDDRVIIYREWDNPIRKDKARIKTEARLVRYQRDTKKFNLVRLSVNGKLAKRGR